jgi:hypothetical protein
MTFRIYDAPTGGVLLWEEEHTSVPVDTGIYTVILGTGTTTSGSFDPSLFSEDNRWLEVEVEGEVFDPRQQLTSVAYAFTAATAGDADTLDGSDSLDFASDIHTHPFTDITGTATDAQIPDTITINQAANADTVDGEHADAFADAVHNHDDLYYTQTHVDGLESRIGALEATVNNLITDLTDAKNRISTLESELATAQSDISTLQAQIVNLLPLGSYVTVVTDPINGLAGPHVIFIGANVHIRSGSGATNEDPTVGLGNLIIGYNELRGTGDIRTGSHNLVVGSKQNYSSYGGLVAGSYNTISGAYASVSGGADNIASGFYSSVSGGRNNEASGLYAFVGGGGGLTADGNEAFGHYSAILGGMKNIAGDSALSDHSLGQQSTVSGGSSNTASGNYASVSAGVSNTASGTGTSVSGGSDNTASYSGASVSGGSDNTASGFFASVSGGDSNMASQSYASVSGGSSNTASGTESAVSGGSGRSVSGSHDWRAGSLFEDN